MIYITPVLQTKSMDNKMSGDVQT